MTNDDTKHEKKGSVIEDIMKQQKDYNSELLSNQIHKSNAYDL